MNTILIAMDEEKEKITSFEDLNCWRACRELYKFIRLKIVPKIPKSDSELKNNIIRAARSSTRNIAEGYGRFSYKDNKNFVIMSRGSLYEIHDDLITLFEECIIDEKLYKESVLICEKAKKLVNGYINYLNKAAAIA